MAKFHLTNKAIEDLSAIWNYTYDTWNENQADKYYALLINSCQNLVKTPFVGKKYDEISLNLRGYKAGKHIIFYQSITKDEVLIIRVLHETMDLKKRIKE